MNCIFRLDMIFAQASLSCLQFFPGFFGCSIFLRERQTIVDGASNIDENQNSHLRKRELGATLSSARLSVLL